MYPDGCPACKQFLVNLHLLVEDEGSSLLNRGHILMLHKRRSQSSYSKKVLIGNARRTKTYLLGQRHLVSNR